jgi:dTDP-4-amino-4,6-dideoxygalactose transaminase
MTMTMSDSVPVLDLSPEIEAQWEELMGAVERVFRSTRFIGGSEVSSFENEASDYLGVEIAVGVNSGTDALVLGLRAMGVGPGDEVITSPFTFFASPESIGIIGATPVFADIEAESMNIDPVRIEEAITPRTKAIMPVHLFGRPADMDAIMDVAARHDLRVIEDCAQSFGARMGADSRYAGRQTGTIGDAGAYSFFPSKNLGAFGDAGLIVTDDETIAELARKLRAHGGSNKYRNEMLGYNSRLDALHAALLRVKLPRIDEKNSGRRAVAGRYNDMLADVAGVETPAIVDGHVFHQYTIRVTGGRRDAVYEALQGDGVGCMLYYPIPCHQLPVYEALGISMPVAEGAADAVLSLPIWPTLGADVQARVVEIIRSALG